MVLEKTTTTGSLTGDDIRQVLAETFSSERFRGRRVLFVIPDATRSCPLPFLFQTIVEELRPRAKDLAFLVALGTHPVPAGEELFSLFGLTSDVYKEKYADIRLEPHRWEQAETFKKIGTFGADQIAELTDGLFSMEVRVAVNRMLFDYDLVVLLGPVFPHEVVGFSGGHKYLFPGVGEKEFINFFHWFGAVITSARIIGRRDTPVRRLVEEAATFLPVETFGISLVDREEDVRGIFTGEVHDAWKKACELSARIHTVTKPKPYRSVLSCAPKLYDDIWTGAKCMYKLEGVIEDGGEVIIYAPHITELSYSHGKVLDRIGYHVRDYFLKQWDRFKRYPWGVVAHSTHLRGVGEFVEGVEKPRIDVVLATGIERKRCEQAALRYRDPATIDHEAWKGREDEGLLYVPHAGETLFRLETPPSWAK